MDREFLKTLEIIINRYGNRTQGSVFIPISDFQCGSGRIGQLNALYAEGFITKPKFFDNGAEIALTKNGRAFFDRRERGISLTKDKIYEILTALNRAMKIPEDNFGYGRTEALQIIR